LATYLATSEAKTVLEVGRVLDENGLVNLEHLVLAFDGKVGSLVVDSN
jgi:hypothetical protein